MNEDEFSPYVATLNDLLLDATPSEIVAEALRSVVKGRVAVVSSFGTESAALLKLVADVDPSTPVIFLDTGWLFEETVAYRDILIDRLGLSDVRVIAASPDEVARQDPHRELWRTDPDACCNLRKVVPLNEALQPFDAWITGRKRYQGGDRALLPIVERDGRRLKFNPFARATQAEIDRMFGTAGLPRHPLEAHGFTSVGCIPCTSRTEAGEDRRAGRWRGITKTECGIHAPSGGGHDSSKGTEQQRRRNRRNAEERTTLPDVFG